MAPGRAARHTRVPATLTRIAGNRAAVRTAGCILLCCIISGSVPPGSARAALLKLRPGPIDLPHHVAAADLDRDGYQDLIVANFQAGTLDLLINQKDGRFAPHPSSPVNVGLASFSNPTAGPLIVLVTDLNPDDVDSDTIANPLDNCPNVPNFSQALTAAGLDGFCGARGPDNICGTSDDDASLFGPDDACGTADDEPGADDNTGLYGGDGICGTGDDVTDSSGPGNACRLLDDMGASLDRDGDGVPDFDPATDSLDNCPLTPNPGQEDEETAAGPDAQCDTADDHPLLYGPDGICGNTDDLIGDGVGDACPLSPDLVILENSVGLNSPLGIVRVRVNNGSGTMNSRPSLLTGLQPSSIVLEDFDGDGLPDVVVSSGDSDALQLFPGGADASFQGQIILDSRDNPQGLATGDFDGDGDADLAVAQSCDHSVGIYRNDGGTLPTTQTAFVSTDFPSPLLIQPSLLVAGSFNDDDLDDLAVLGSEGRMTCTAGWGERLGRCCSKPVDCEDPADLDDDGTGVCTASGADQGIVQVFLGTFLCSGGPNDGGTCADDTDCADTPPDPATDGNCVTLAPNPATTILLPAGERATAAIWEDFDADGLCGGIEAGSCDTGGTDTCVNPAAGGEPCSSDAECTRNLCNVGPYTGRVCQQNRDCSTGDLALTIGRAAGGNGRVSIHAGLGNGGFSPAPSGISGFQQPVSLTPFDLDPTAGAQPDLAVLDRDVQRTLLFDNDDIAGSLSFTVTPASPASAWKASSALDLQAIDLSVGIDLVLLQETSPRLDGPETPPRLDSLSGIGNGFFRSLPPLEIEGTIDGLPALTRGTDLMTSNLRDDARLDLVVLDTSDPSTGYLTVVLNTLFGVLEESETFTVPGGFASATSGSLITDLSDYDRDGVPNLTDNCPTRFNPPFCPVTDASCRVEIVCDDPALSPTDCAITSTTGQCDSDGNGIGDHCQILDDQCLAVDSEFDFEFDYDPTALGTTSGGATDFDRDGIADTDDNCPTTANNDQADDNRAEGADGICLTADDNVYLYGLDAACGTPDDEIGNFIGDACEIPLQLAQGDCNTNTGMCDAPAGVSCTTDGDCVTCTGASDADNDGVCDYDPRVLPQPDEDSAVAAALDNCLGRFNPRSACSDDPTVLCDKDADCGPAARCTQPDTDGDRVGNACIIAAALDNCPFTINTNQNDADADGVGDSCARPAADLLTVAPDGKLTPFTGDGSGRLYASLTDPFTGLSLANPSSALVGNFSLSCTDFFNTICFTTSTTDVLVAETGVIGDPNDDRLTLLQGDGTGNFAIDGTCDTSGLCDTGSGTCQSPASAAGDACSVDGDCDRCDASNPDTAGLSCAADADCRRPVPAPTQGDPAMLRLATAQPVCPSPQDPSRPQLRFDTGASSSIIVVPQPGTSTIGLFLPSNQALSGQCVSGPFTGQPCAAQVDCELPSDPGNGGFCTAGSAPTLVPPPGYPPPLPVPAPLTAVTLADMNGDGVTDIVALSSGDGNPATPNLTLYIGIANGLYFTDPTLNPDDVPDGATLMAAANINLMSDVVLPEVTLFYPPEDGDGDGMLDPGEDLNGNGVLDGDRGPIVLTNVLNERADIDGSGRVDGFDMAILSRAFGAARGEDFSLVEIDGQVQLAQTGTGKCALGANDGQDCTGDIDCPGGTCRQLFRRVLDHPPGPFVGKDIPNSDGVCNLVQDRMSAGRCDTAAGTCTSPGSKIGVSCTGDQDCGDALYGLAVDINLDGLVDGLDLAIIASLFGRSL